MPSQNNPTFTFEVQNMKKLAAAFLLGCGILMAGSASAEEKEFGPDFGRFIIDVPDGWNARVIENGVQVVSKDNQSSVMVAIFRVKKAKDGVETLLSFKGDKCHSVTIIGDVEKVTSIVRSLRDK